MRNTPPTPRRVRSAQESRSATVRAAAAAPSRRQQSRWQREQHQQRLLFIAIAALVAVIAAIFVAGVGYDNLVRPNQTVAQVGPDSITAGQLLDEVRPRARALDAQAKQLGPGANIADYVDQQKRGMPDQVLNGLVDERIIQQEATRRGISVSASDLDDRERQAVADFQASTNPSPTLEPTPVAEASPTPEAGTAATPASTPSPASAALNPALTPTAVPTLDAAGYGPALQQLLDQNNLTEAELRKQLEASMLRNSLQTAIGQSQVADTQEQVHARQIQVASAQQANDLLSQLQGGADFAQLAQQNSTDATSANNGGDMGWFGRGVKAKTIEDATFALQPGQLSDVIQDSSGFHVIQLLERDPARPVPADQLATQRQKAFTDWLTSRRSSQDVKIQLDQGQKDWILARIGIRP